MPEANKVKVPSPPGLNLPWSSRRKAAAGPPAGHSDAWAHLSEAEVLAIKAARAAPVNLEDVQKLLYAHGADKVVGSSLVHVDFVVTLGGKPSTKVVGEKRRGRQKRV